MAGTAMTESIGIGNAQFEGQHVGIRQHRSNRPSGKQGSADATASGGATEQEGHDGVADDGWHGAVGLFARFRDC
ncbi:hypothetical protein GCM10008098_14960 [Rhodanobacter panaciterrae]|uniref:Uncharacterized protein n=1 Tax=Rhodanobacter panaciterrae TaxID=490572 RepID=A0ABQ2ZQE8_9GAMM|nr:hypothetical protein GCM10008098_14960 [Rhodanobacter panaciterrae]